MEKIVAWRVVTGRDPLDLMIKVEGYIDEGWQPLGDLTVVRNELMNETYYLQTMVKYGNPNGK